MSSRSLVTICRGIAFAVSMPMLAGCQSMTGKTAVPAAIDVASARAAGESAYAAADWRGAEPHYRALVTAVPQDAELWFRLGNIYARSDQPDAAVSAYREALVRDADLGKAWFNMGVIQLRQAANSFLKMNVHAAAGDPAAVQGAAAYEAVMAILGQQDATPGPIVVPAGEPDASLPQ
jgi:Flp pilus assembly protein TadD